MPTPETTRWVLAKPVTAPGTYALRFSGDTITGVHRAGMLSEHSIRQRPDWLTELIYRTDPESIQHANSQEWMLPLVIRWADGRGPVVASPNQADPDPSEGPRNGLVSISSAVWHYVADGNKIAIILLKDDGFTAFYVIDRNDTPVIGTFPDLGRAISCILTVHNNLIR